MSAIPYFCPGCGLTSLQVPLPIEPRYTISEAATLNRMKTASLARWLTAHKNDAGLGPRQYQGTIMREKRMLSAADVRYISSVVLRSHRHRKHFRLPELVQIEDALTPKPASAQPPKKRTQRPRTTAAPVLPATEHPRSADADAVLDTGVTDAWRKNL